MCRIKSGGRANREGGELERKVVRSDRQKGLVLLFPLWALPIHIHRPLFRQWGSAERELDPSVSTREGDGEIERVVGVDVVWVHFWSLCRTSTLCISEGTAVGVGAGYHSFCGRRARTLCLFRLNAWLVLS